MNTKTFLTILCIIAGFTTQAQTQIPDKYLIENQRVGAFIIGGQIPEQTDFTLEKTLQEICWESECDTVPFFIVSESGCEMFSFSFSATDSTNFFINDIFIVSEQFKTEKGIGINSTVEDFAEKYPDYSIEYSYVSDRYKIGTKQLEDIWFILEEDCYIGNNDILYSQDGVELKLSDLKKEIKITAIRIF